MLRNSCRGVFAIAPWLVLMGMLALAGTSLSSAVGQGTGFVAFFFIIFLPFPGILGWLTGRGIAWMLWP